MAIINSPSAVISTQSSGQANEPPPCTTCRATRPIIHSPLASSSPAAHNTAAKKRPNTACISRSRCGGSSAASAGRRKKCAKAMPPTHNTTASTCKALSNA